MAKLVILALAFTAIVAFAEVSAYTTTTITTITEELPSRGSQSQSQGQCRRQIQGQQVSHCQMHIIEGSSFQDADLIRMRVVNPTRQQEPHLQLCCQQLRNVEEECQCEAINQAYQEAQRQQQQQQQQQGGSRGGWQGQQGGGQSMQQQMLRKRAEQIPNQCNLQVQQCPIQQGQWF